MRIKKITIISVIAFLAFQVSGCLVPEKVAYTINLDGKTSGTVTMQLFNIKSNASTDEEFEEDKNNLFNYIMTSDKLVSQLKDEGKEITS
ncbi:MAG TPA: hypothetical protein VKA26_02260, partial [Ignavibacteriaceae bacterium]|nr:hypothetical protein [Ignavibacteriaceae bacterium]